jgi:tripartite-type tricarboxylate transporter receptor subunit TctC
MRPLLVVIILLLTACDGPGQSKGPGPVTEDFFAGKTITYIVATNPGGGYDMYARLVARYMEKHLDGANIRIRNVPGAGNIVGANQLYISKPDGLTIGTFNTGLIYAQLLRQTGIRFDLRELSWIGKAASDPRVLIVSRQSGLRSIEDLLDKDHPLLFGSSGPGSASHNETLFLKKMLGLDARLVNGLGGNKVQMSMLRGEIVGVFASYSALRTFVESGSGIVLLHINGQHQFGDTVPSAESFVHDEAGAVLLSLIRTTSTLGRLTAAPPGTDPQVLARLRSAYAAALADPGLLAEAERLRIPIDPLIGGDVAEMVSAVLDLTAREFAALEAVSSD